MKRILLPLLLLIPVIVSADSAIITHSKVITVTPDIETSAYAAGDLIGEKLTLADAARNTPMSALVHAIVLADADLEGADIDVVIFDADPTNTTFTDNAALDIDDADLDKVACVVSLTTHVAFSDNGVSTATGVNCPVELSSSTTMYAALVARGAPTYTASTDLDLKVGILQD